ncbi:MAG: PAS domain-containing protein [Burkholderiales bacterium]|nr:PAS domain-containing protein [Burkholderiales bacterium]
MAKTAAASKRKAPAKKARNSTLRRPAQKKPARSVSAGVPDRPAATGALPPGPCVAAIGASAGGFEAIRTFLDTMPADSGIAFVVIQHLHPTQKSLAAELFGKRTSMPVVQAEDGMRVEPNHVYTIPPNTYPSIHGGVLRLAAPTQLHGPRLPIDHFFASLGEDQHERAIGIVLSGSGSDGALGVKSIAANGGIVLAQRPDTAQFDGMPQSAIASGMVNHILPVAKMPEVLTGYARHPYAAGAARQETVAQSEEAGLESVLDLVRGRRGYSFSGYKRSTLLRRVLRRMGLRSIERWDHYVDMLHKNPAEIDALFRDFLIGVTEFFRDPDAWNILQSEVITALVHAKPMAEPIRVWVPGCATGEEAYAIAMLLLENLKLIGKHCPVQVFATDTNEETLQVGRDGVYPAGVATRISPERLRRFFVETAENHHYQVARELRESVIFGVQNLVADPPFSRLDLISCRNLLIYLESDIQKKIVALFEFALRPGGYLFLGSAETIGDRGDLLKPISKKWRIYQRGGGLGHQPLELVPINEMVHAPGAAAAIRRAPPRGLQLAGRAQQLILDRFAPAAVLVNGRSEILYLCGPVENYLRRPRGAPTQDLLAQARDGLRAGLRSALREAQAREATVSIANARVKRDGGFAPVRLTVTPAGLDGDSTGLLLVVFQDEVRTAPASAQTGGDNELVRQLEDELRVTKDDLQNSVERMEASNEELKVSNEEVVSVNEELQSINEELESSKEELQSLNEELSTVNQQLQDKVVELEAANDDLKNLLASSDVATVCIDHGFHIRWFTPAMNKLFNLIDSDIGRPISDFRTALSGSDLLEQAAMVLDELTPVQRQLHLDDGRWYQRRLIPYLGADQSINGVVITFVDITEARLAADAVVAAQKKATESLEQKVHQRTAQLRALAVELSLAEERERRSLAQDLHDDLGQVLAIIKHKLTALHGSRHSAHMAGELKAIEDLTDRANRSIRTLVFQLSPPVLHTLGLFPALEWLTEEMERAYGLKVHLSDDGAPKKLDEPSRTTLFRAVRELLINVAKHAGARAAELSCMRSGDRVTLVVNDDGGGFDYQKLAEAAPGTGGIGLVSLRERVEFIGGEMHVDSRPGKGTTVTIIAPIHDSPGETAP